MEETQLYYAEDSCHGRVSFSLQRRLMLISTGLSFVVVVVVECLRLYGKQESLHRGQDEFLYRSLQKCFVVQCICGSRGQVDTVV